MPVQVAEQPRNRTTILSRPSRFEQLRDHLKLFWHACIHARRLKALKGLAPAQLL